jgi:hypothetical protein
MKTVPCEFGEIVPRRPALPTTANREALARGWLIYLAVMLVFAGLATIFGDNPKPASLATAPTSVAAHSVPGKFSH